MARLLLLPCLLLPLLLPILLLPTVFSADNVTTPHVCQPSGKCFTVVTSLKLAWEKAEEYCENNFNSGRLASVHNAFESAIISGWLPFLNTDPWIGAYRVGDLNFHWSDETDFTYTNWANGQPSDRCAQICHTNTADCQQGKWKAVSCTSEAQTVCEYTDPTLPTTTPAPQCSSCTDCLDWYNGGQKNSGIYTISPPGVDPFPVYCDMDTAGGGWTIFQKRIDSNLTFYSRTWSEYKSGFSNGLDQNFWLGNDRINALTKKDSNVQLRIELKGDRAPGSSHTNDAWFAEHLSFAIGDEAHLYALHVGVPFTGNASSSSGYGIYGNNGQPFSTIDKDNGGGSCATSSQTGGWWTTYGCQYVSLNGKYVPNTWQSNQGFEWNVNGQYRINPRESQMKLRKLQ